jgi:hypothetical protein
MLEMGTSGLMSGAGKRGGASASALALSLDSTSRGSLQSFQSRLPLPSINSRRFCQCLRPNLLIVLEREIGFERFQPATSSLGRRLSIDNKQHSVFVSLVLAIGIIQFSF